MRIVAIYSAEEVRAILECLGLRSRLPFDGRHGREGGAGRVGISPRPLLATAARRLAKLPQTPVHGLGFWV